MFVSMIVYALYSSGLKSSLLLRLLLTSGHLLVLTNVASHRLCHMDYHLSLCGLEDDVSFYSCQNTCREE